MRLIVAVLMCALSALCHAQIDRECRPFIAANAGKANTVVLAKIVSVGPSPGYWSGLLEARQQVTYKVQRLLKGTLHARQFSLNILVVANSPEADRDKPQLNPKLFYPGATQILFLNARLVKVPNVTEQELVDLIDTRCSIATASPGNVARAQKSIGASSP